MLVVRCKNFIKLNIVENNFNKEIEVKRKKLERTNF